METSLTEEEQRKKIYLQVLEDEIVSLQSTLKSIKEHGDLFETHERIRQLERLVEIGKAELAQDQKSTITEADPTIAEADPTIAEANPTITEAIYIINSHGAILSETSRSIRNLWREETEYYAITIPKNVELYTFTKIGKVIVCSTTGDNYLCERQFVETPETFKYINRPAFKYVHEQGQPNKFPELILAPEVDYSTLYHSGIVHCVPQIIRAKIVKYGRGKKIIYNISARNTQDCKGELINSKGEPYNSVKNYDEDYRTTLARYNYNPHASPSSINPCGPILLSEALTLIQQYSKNHYGDTCKSKIYLNTCLKTIDLYRYLAYHTEILEDTTSITSLSSDDSKYTSSIEENEKEHLEIKEAMLQIEEKIKTIKEEMESIKYDYENIARYAELIRDLKIKEDELAEQSGELVKNIQHKATLMRRYHVKEKSKKKERFRHDHSLDIIKHNTMAKVVKTNRVKSFDEFKTTDLDGPLHSTYLFMLKTTDGNIKKLTIITDKLHDADYDAKPFNKLQDNLNEALERLKSNSSFSSNSFPPQSTIAISNPNVDKIHEELQKLVSQDGGNNKILQKKYKSRKQKSRKQKSRKQKSRKQKSRKYKNIKQKSRKQKSRKQKSRKFKHIKQK
uniref:Uncharacterized protein n=1 Tax=viral metagenome TaxID=1070528 RepID=A0A6C0DWF1_9ZZZZ